MNQRKKKRKIVQSIGKKVQVMKINQTDEVQSEIEDMIHYYSLFDPYNNKDGGETDTFLFIICLYF